MLRGLKIEKNTVFAKHENSEIWEKATSTSIPQLEDLLKKLDGIQYSKEDKKEDFVFENEVNIGPGTIKSSRDEDGDIVITYRKENNNQALNVINEDFDFDFDGGQKISNEPIVERKLVNFWSASNNTELKNIQDNREIKEQNKKINDKKTAMKKVASEAKKLKETINSSPSKSIVFDVSSEKPLRNEPIKQQTNKKVQNTCEEMVDIFNRPVCQKLINRITNLTVNDSKNSSFKIKERGNGKIIKNQSLMKQAIQPVRTVVPKIVAFPATPLEYSFQKRLAHSVVTKGGRALQVLLRGLEQIESRKDSRNFQSQTITRSKDFVKKEVSFIKKIHWDNKERKHADFLKFIFENRKKTKNFDATFMKFQLKEISLKACNDDEFDKLLNEAAVANVE